MMGCESSTISNSTTSEVSTMEKVIFQNLPIEIVVFDKEKAVIDCNQSFANLCKRLNPSTVSGLYLRDIFADDNLFGKLVNHALNTGEQVDLPIKTHSLFDSDKNVISIRFSCIISRLFFKDQSYATLTVTCKHENVQAEKISKPTDILTNVSHELLTPLHCAMLSSKLLLSKLQSHQDQEETHYTEYLSNIHDSCQDAMKMLNNILEFSELDLKTAYFSSKFFVKEFFNTLVDKYLPYITQAVEITTEFSHDIPTQVVAPKCRLLQAVDNVLDNAVKFTKSGRIKVRVGFDQGSCSLIITVSDTGIGIAEEDIENSFTPFFQKDLSTKKSYKGLGLGLTIAQRVMERLGGDIRIDSKLGGGTTVHITVPVKLEKNRDLKNNTHSTKITEDDTSKGETSRFGNMRILLVDDNMLNKTLTARLLNMLGIHNIDTASDGYEALLKVKSKGEQYDLVFMDIQMPRMDGYESTRLIRTFNGDIPILALSANVLKEDVDKALQCGMNEHISKPLDIRYMKRMLEKWSK